MSQKEKLIERLKSRPKDFTFDEAEKVLRWFGFNMRSSGKTSGSRVTFINDKLEVIKLHKPHPQNELKTYALDQLIEFLEEKGLI